MKKLLSSLLLSLLLIGGAGLTANAASPKTSAEEVLSDYGRQTMSDVAGCLRTGKSLDVYYLIDNSKSLGPDAAAGTPGTDPNYVRARIVAQDIRRWADISRIQPALTIRISGSFFAGTTSTIASWHSLTTDNSAKIASQYERAIKAKPLDFFTNWTAGLSAADRALRDSPSDCKALIWFTDGGLWSASPRTDSLSDLQALCGASGPNGIPSRDSATGVIAKLRRAKVYVFGIMLQDQASIAFDAPDEAFYRSLMQPIVEESGSTAALPGSIPSATMKCGENLPAESRNYATGAFLKAKSAGEVAYSFLLLSGKTRGATVTPQESSAAGGHFWIDPGIKSFEVLTSSDKWSVLDAKGSVIKSNSETDLVGTTGLIKVPAIKAPEQWTFKSTGPMTLLLYPELYLKLHDKALLSGQPADITGQFVSNLNTDKPADLAVFKSTAITAAVDHKAVKATVSPGGVFSISGYTPNGTGASAQVDAQLLLKTAHHNLDPLTFRQSEQVFSTAALPTVGAIKFAGPIQGTKGTAVATATLHGPTKANKGTICFSAPQVISDKQDQSSGRAIDRSSSWSWKTTGLDESGCQELAKGATSTVRFALSNPFQATASVSALFDYTMQTLKVDPVRDSQTAATNTQVLHNQSLFWLWLVLLLLLGLGIPFAILTGFNIRSARLSGASPLARLNLPVKYSLHDSAVVLRNGAASPSEVEASKAATDSEPIRVPASGVKNWQDQGMASTVRVQAVRPKWPLSKVAFVLRYDQSKEAVVVVGSLAGATPKPDGSVRLASGRLDKLSFFSFPAEEILKARAAGSDTNGELVAFMQDRGIAEEYQELLTDHLNSPQSRGRDEQSVKTSIEGFKAPEPSFPSASQMSYTADPFGGVDAPSGSARSSVQDPFGADPFATSGRPAAPTADSGNSADVFGDFFKSDPEI